MKMTTGIKPLATCLLSAFIAMACLAGQVLADGLRQDALKIPAVIAGPSGSTSVELEGIVVRPDDGQPHPLAILNHGSPRMADQRPKMSPYALWAQAAAFARRGWVAVAFLRRGYGQSGGGWAENWGACSHPDYASAGRAGAGDIAAVAKFMHAQPYVSNAKWISVGVSAGGFATVALTANPPPDLAAAISFAPGRGSTGPDTVCGESRLVSAFADYGRTSRIPLLWVSAENDHFFGPQLVSQLTAAFSKVGGNLTYVATPPFADDGHKLFSAADGMPIWSPIVDRFLSANKLALRDGLIDVPVPNVAAPSSLSSRGRESFKTYLESGPNKAFAVAGDGHFGWATARRSSDEARKDALAFCASGAPAGCTIVNVNNAPIE
jgi:dienelactone hydrolase